MFVEGYDAAILGIVERDGFLVVVYDKWAMVNVYRAMYTEASWEDAVEDLSFNTWCAYMGELTPIFMHTFDGSGEERRHDAEDYFYDMTE